MPTSDVGAFLSLSSPGVLFGRGKVFKQQIHARAILERNPSQYNKKEEILSVIHVADP